MTLLHVNGTLISEVNYILLLIKELNSLKYRIYQGRGQEGQLARVSISKDVQI
jgi:hypothetical protein